MEQSESAQSSRPPSHGPSLTGLSYDDSHKPAAVRHMSAPPNEAQLRHHNKRPFHPRRHVKETLNARSAYSNSEDDGTAEHRINQYLIKQEIGRGSFGAVHLAVDQFGEEYAVKEFSKSRLRKRAQSNLLRKSRGANSPQIKGNHEARRDFNSPLHRQSIDVDMGNSLDLIREEIAIMKKLDHPNVVSLVEVLDDPSEDSLYMVMEMCKKGVVMKVGLDDVADPYEPDRCRVWFRDMLLGIEYLHAQNIIHRDIKPDNCLITSDDVLKIVDFGVSEIFDKDNVEMTTKKSAGSPAFMPPELCVAKHGEVSGRAADVWSMGATLFCLCFGRIPFFKTGVLELYESIKSDPVQFGPDTDPELKDLLSCMLEKDPAKRITLDGIREHPWVTKNGEWELSSKAENTANIVQPPTEAEVNAAITAPILRMVTVMKAATKFKRLIAHKRPDFFSGTFGPTAMVAPPLSISNRAVSRTQSETLPNRTTVDQSLAAEGIHRDFRIKDDGTKTHVLEEDKSPDDLEKRPGPVQVADQSEWPTPGNQPRAPLSAENSFHEPTTTTTQTPTSTAHQQNPSPAPSGAISIYSEDNGKGHARDPLEELLFLNIGPGSDLPPVKSSDGVQYVSESPGAVDINVYEKAYEEEIARILAAQKPERRPTLYLTKRVEGAKHLREHKAITDFGRVASSAAEHLGRLAEAAKGGKALENVGSVQARYQEKAREDAKTAVDEVKGGGAGGKQEQEEWEGDV